MVGYLEPSKCYIQMKQKSVIVGIFKISTPMFLDLPKTTKAASLSLCLVLLLPFQSSSLSYSESSHNIKCLETLQHEILDLVLRS